MTDEQAFQLTKEYMGNLNIGNMMKGVASGRGTGKQRPADKHAR